MANNNLLRNSTRKQFAVLWEAVGFNEYGEHTVDSPKEIKVRIEKGRTQTLDATAETIASEFTINVGQAVKNGSIIWLGKLTDLPTSPTDLFQVIDYQEVPSVNSKRFDRCIKVMRFHESLPDVIASTATTTTSGAVQAGELIWRFITNDIDSAAWDAFVATLPLSEGGPNRKGSNSESLTFSSGGQNYKIYVPINYQVPEIKNGRLFCDRETASKRIFESSVEETHCQFAPRGDSGSIWSDNFYLGPNRRYRYTFEVDLDDGGTSETRWKSIKDGASPDPGNFCILLDLHPGTFPVGWGADVQPPIGLYVLDGFFKAFVRGAVGTNLAYTKTGVAQWDFSAGSHVFEVEWQINHDSTLGIQQDCNVVVKMDNIERANFSQEIGLNGGASVAGALFSKMGIYGSRTAASYKSFDIVRL